MMMQTDGKAAKSLKDGECAVVMPSLEICISLQIRCPRKRMFYATLGKSCWRTVASGDVNLWCCWSDWRNLAYSMFNCCSSCGDILRWREVSCEKGFHICLSSSDRLLLGTRKKLIIGERTNPNGKVQYATSNECRTVIRSDGSVIKSKNLLGDKDSMLPLRGWMSRWWTMAFPDREAIAEGSSCLSTGWWFVRAVNDAWGLSEVIEVDWTPFWLNLTSGSTGREAVMVNCARKQMVKVERVVLQRWCRRSLNRR